MMNLTSEQIEQNGEAVKAWMRGEPIQWAALDHPNNWFEENNATFSFGLYLYRPAPKPKPPEYIPFTRETIPMPCVVRHKASGSRHVIVVAKNGCLYPAGVLPVSYDELFSDYTMDDGTPCGTLKQ